jgi:hypothetical protein
MWFLTYLFLHDVFTSHYMYWRSYISFGARNEKDVKKMSNIDKVAKEGKVVKNLWIDVIKDRSGLEIINGHFWTYLEGSK